MRKNLNLMYIISFLQGLIFYGPVSLIYKIQKRVSVKEAFFLEFFFINDNGIHRGFMGVFC